MNRRLISLLALLVLFGAIYAVQRHAMNSKARSHETALAVIETADEKAIAILTAAQKACASFTSGTYESLRYSKGDAAFLSPRLVATVRFDSPRSAIHVSGSIIPADGIERDFDEATDGKTLATIDYAQSRILRYPDPRFRYNLRQANKLELPEFGAESAFENILLEPCKYEGTSEVDGVACDVVYVPGKQRSGTRWFFGEVDHLPRRKEMITNNFPGRKEEEKIVLEIRGLTDYRDDAPGDFSLPWPDGYAEYDAPRLGALLKPGTRAPDWTIEADAGLSVGLADMRGQVVVMTFWSTWCRKSRRALNQLELLHDEMKTKKVNVVGISCWEFPRNDPEEFFPVSRLSYTVLKGGSQVARQYRAEELPVTYVIDGGGEIVFAIAGYEDGANSAILGAVKEALERLPT